MRKSRLTRRTPLERQPMTRRAACDCTHERSEHTPAGGACLVCACTWYHPNVRAVRQAVTRKKRSASETRRIYGTPERIAWLKQQPCVVMGCGRGPCEVAHTQNGGTGRKADACHTIPLCPTHHRESHVVGVQTFERLHHLDLAALAAHTERQWQAVQSAPVPLSRIVPGVVAKLRGEA